MKQILVITELAVKPIDLGGFYLKKILAVMPSITLFLILITSVSASEGVSSSKSNVQSYYNVNIEEWSKFNDKYEMIAATSISQDILKELKTEELVEAVLIPFINNLYAYSSYTNCSPDIGPR